VIDLAICRLQRIISGAADGSIPQNDPAVLLDIASLCLVRAVLRPLRAHFFDVIKNADGSVTLEPGSEFGTFCGNSANDAIVVGFARDMAGAWALFNRAAQVLNVASNSIIANIVADVDAAVVEALDDDNVNDIPDACRVTINTQAGINATNFRNFTMPFDAPSGC
jgi:hypothetical protein